MSKLSEKIRRIRRKILQTLGVTGATLIFSAGYSMVQTFYINGTVQSKATDEPLQNIRVTLNDDDPDSDKMETLTDEEGAFSFSLGTRPGIVYIIEFEEAGGENQFAHKRIVHRRDGSSLEIKLNER